MTLFIPSGQNGEHLFVVVLGPKIVPGYQSEDQFLIVPICSAIPGKTHECPLHPGCHPFVRHESYADFAYADIRNKIDLISKITTGVFRDGGASIDSETLENIEKSLNRSRRVPRFIKRDFLSI
ncbi:hypothetical protein [Ferrovum myxofaciens]|uniref:Uncharacterized protein n=1 Tax=Ferrovum myxofaciens TaxID=416213 RepID=A0A149VW56_9PROT|nr:hypothetical protein [Ferrovum myxofaciens]KXW57452.1 hypothetical protein FEMY_20150 [Ferrovum myxofaciens]MBU6994253.1 hypothetical protein [Ferrovum myxofaciens]